MVLVGITQTLVGHFPHCVHKLSRAATPFRKPPSNPINFRQRLGCRYAHSRSRRWLTHSDDDHNDDDGDADGGDDGADYDDDGDDDDADDDDYGGDDKDGVDDGEDGGDECVDDDGAADDHEVLI